MNSSEVTQRYLGPGSVKSLYGLTSHATPISLCIIFQCKMYIYLVLCLVEINLKTC